jgi:ELWxxDGT repeat protein
VSRIILFDGTGPSGRQGLWVTNGTAQGTQELSVHGAFQFGLNPVDITPFNGRAVFAGLSSNDHIGLWITDGTAQGTSEITDSDLFNTGGGFDNPNFTVFDSEILFAGVNSNGQIGLWVSDGTAQGTHEITGINGASSEGVLIDDIVVPHFIVFNDEVFFAGTNASGQFGLWVSDGTAQGTHELTGIAGANLTSSNAVGVAPTDFIVFNGQMLFAGTSSDGQRGLWVSDGTAQGTHELTGIAGANTGPYSLGLNPSDLFVFDGEVLFLGVDASGEPSLWVTDGTGPGTQELTGISNTFGRGLFYNVNDPRGGPDFTTFNGKVLFSGVDASGQRGLWASDGTAQGTHELTGISGASLGGLFDNGAGYSTYPDFTVFGDEVLFDAVDSDGQMALWVTDGTGQDTHEIAGTARSSIDFAPRFLTVTDVKPTLSGVAGSITFVPQHTITVSPSVSVSDSANPTLASATVNIAGGSFANDGDVLTANTTGTNIVASYDPSTETLTLTGTDTLAGYQAVLDSVTFASGNNPSNGDLNPTRTITWIVNDGSSSSAAVTTTISITAVVKNDFNGDGKSDILWQNADGEPAIWEMNGTSIAFANVLPNPGPTWHIETSVDLNHDGKADITFQNSDGLPEIWLMNGTSVTSAVTLSNPGSSWHVVADADFNADGNPDILWQNNDGDPAIWELNGTNIIAANVLSNPGSSWHVMGAGDFNGDRKADIIFQNSDGLPEIWLMNGTSVTSAVTHVASAVTLQNPGATWNIKDDAKLASPLQYEVRSAESLITAQVLANPASSDAKHLTNNRALVDEIANDIAAQSGTAQSFYQIGTSDIEDGFINPSSEIGAFKDIQFLDQCVALVRALDYNVPSSTSWHPAPLSQVDLGGDSGVLGFNQLLASGAPVPIATFNNGSSSGTYNGEHAAFFLGYGFEANHAGFFVLDQYNNPNGLPFPPTHPLDVNVYEPAEVRFISFSDSAASTYYVIAPH